MASDESRDPAHIGGIEHELTAHLERAHDLAEQAQRANGAAQQEIDRALEIANGLSGRVRKEK